MLKLTNEIIAKYCEPHRKYHNLKHLMDMVQAHEKYKGNFKFLDTIIHDAILYHDIIYNSDGKNTVSNEQQSADFYEAHIGGNRRQTVYDMILATEYHFAERQYDEITSYFLDLDLISLATPDKDELIATQSNIDFEFKYWSDDITVLRGRQNFIENHLSKAKFRVLQKIDPNLQIQMDKNIKIIKNHYWVN